MAMVFQNYALYPHLTVRDNISFGLRLGRMSKRTSTLVTRLPPSSSLARCSTAARPTCRAASINGSRWAVRSCAIPSVFLFDEPLSNLDAKLRTQMRAEIKRLHSRLRNTVIYVTHDQLEAMTLADRIVVMRGGVIEQMGTPKGSSTPRYRRSSPGSWARRR